MKKKSKKCRTLSQHQKDYKYVLPSAKVFSDFKHRKALHQEIAAGKALATVEDGTRVTLHFDTTGRSRVEGELPALILKIISLMKISQNAICIDYVLYSLHMRTENR